MAQVIPAVQRLLLTGLAPQSPTTPRHTPLVKRLVLSALGPQSPKTPVRAWQTGNPPTATPRQS